ncbi:MAG: putative selenium-dependent hydroxylase accessory protein YqeC [Lachnospiraceae bacterium]|nr:putative selenium-dependent hydroxylase accessory protein YqeC [Lachnospiraceae bacterium]
MQDGRKVLVCTTTHMLAESDTLILETGDDSQETGNNSQETGNNPQETGDNSQEAGKAPLDAERDPAVFIQKALQMLNTQHFCMAGSRCRAEPQKIEMLPAETFAELKDAADVCLIEADGAKHFPCKCPAEHEPAIMEGTDLIILVMGLAAIGQKVSDAVFRYQLLEPYGITGEQIVDESLLRFLTKEVYGAKLNRLWPHIPIVTLDMTLDSDFPANQGGMR